MRPFIVISGNSGVGKSTLTKLLSQKLNWNAFIDHAEKNPYLQDFLGDMNLWGLHVQLFYLARHLRDSHPIELSDRPIIRDRSFYEGAEIYARNLYQEGKMTERDWRLYRSLYEPILPSLPKPDLLVYLRADVETLMKRIAKRGRYNENTYTMEYLTNLNSLYEQWVSTFTLCPVLPVNVEDFDFIERPEDLDRLIREIKKYLNIID